MDQQFVGSDEVIRYHALHEIANFVLTINPENVSF